MALRFALKCTLTLEESAAQRRHSGQRCSMRACSGIKPAMCFQSCRRAGSREAMAGSSTSRAQKSAVAWAVGGTSREGGAGTSELPFRHGCPSEWASSACSVLVGTALAESRFCCCAACLTLLRFSAACFLARCVCSVPAVAKVQGQSGQANGRATALTSTRVAR